MSRLNRRATVGGSSTGLLSMLPILAVTSIMVATELFEERPQVVNILLDDPARLIWGRRVILIQGGFLVFMLAARIGLEANGLLSGSRGAMTHNPSQAGCARQKQHQATTLASMGKDVLGSITVLTI